MRMHDKEKNKQTSKKTATFVQSDLFELLYRSITLIFTLLSRQLIACKDEDKSFFPARPPYVLPSASEIIARPRSHGSTFLLGARDGCE